MLTGPDDIEDCHDPETFLDLLSFGVHRRLAELWLARRRDWSPPPLDDLGPNWRALGPDYAYRWVLAEDGQDLVGAEFGPAFADYMQRNLRGARFSAHAPGEAGRRMREIHLFCLRTGTSFAVLRRRHPFPERCSGYEALIVPVREKGTDSAGHLLGHLLPFAPAHLADVLRRPGTRPDIGRRLVVSPGA